MALNQKKSKHDAHDMKGASTVDPTRASKPAEPTYKFPLTKGLPTLPDKTGPDGESAPLTGYARGQYGGPSSVSVGDSADMTDFQNLAQNPDPVLKSLQVNGHGDQSGENNAVSDLQRKIDTMGYPPAHGARSRNGEGGKIPGAK